MITKLTRKQARNYYGIRRHRLDKHPDFLQLTSKGGKGKGFSTHLKKQRASIQRHIALGHNVTSTNLEWYMQTKPGYYWKHFGELKKYLDENHKGENLCYYCLRQLSKNKFMKQEYAKRI